MISGRGNCIFVWELHLRLSLKKTYGWWIMSQCSAWQIITDYRHAAGSDGSLRIQVVRISQ